jgi:beta-galactosidase
MNYHHLPFPPFKMDWFGDILITKEGFSQELSDLIKRIYRDVVIYGEEKLPHETKQLIKDPHILKTTYQMYGKYVANWGTQHVTYTFKGFINKQQVIEIKRGNDYLQEFLVYADSQELLIGDTYDVTRITIEAINENGMRLPYSSEVFEIETDDLLEIIGSSHISLIGGARSFWVKTKQKTGTSYLTISHDRYTEVIPIQIKEENE